MLNNMTVKLRLLAGFVLVALLGAAVAGIGAYNMGTMNQHTQDNYKYHLLGISAAKEANINLIMIGREVRSALLSSTPEDKRKFSAAAEAARAQLREQLDVARPLFRSAKGKAFVAEVDQAMAG
jgi:CHASE3 domain sensor protein